MVKQLLNVKFSGRSQACIENGISANPQFDYEFEPSMTDQTFNYSIADKVEDFIAAGQVISAAAQNRSPTEYINPETSPFGLYEKDLPETQADIQAEVARLSELLEKEEISKKEREAMEIYLNQLKQAGGDKGDGV